jgi:hypothetical protein
MTRSPLLRSQDDCSTWRGPVLPNVETYLPRTTPIGSSSSKTWASSGESGE